ncbi:spermatogenesis-associated protein 46 isoform X4 [Anser cygnoides]|uniref:spermatogenesis-associated protein 46 isoform X4 n=1 Tax=Anser cygnoides TaxID=8845 RepID=UPI0034D30C4E
MESFVVPSLPVGAMPCGTRRGSLKPPCPWDPGSLPGIPKAVGAASSSASSLPPALPPCLCSSAWDSPTWPQAAASPGSELPARTIYRPWFSPYSYFTCTAAASQQHLSSGLAIGAQEPEEADNLSETICSSSCSSEEPQPSQQGRQTTSRVSITVRDILAAARGQPVPQHGYKCRACCRVFPTLWALKTHIQHSSQEGYSCKAYYRKLKVLLEKEHQAQEAEAPPGTRAAPAAAGGHCSIAAAASAINATRSRACCSPGRHGCAAAPR